MLTSSLVFFAWVQGASTFGGLLALYNALLLCIAMGVVAGVGLIVPAFAHLLGLGLASFKKFTIFSYLYFSEIGFSDMTSGNWYTAILLGFCLASVIPFGAYLGWQALHGNRRFDDLKRRIVNMVSRRATSFRRADLSEANFTESMMEYANLHGGNFRRCGNVNQAAYPLG